MEPTDRQLDQATAILRLEDLVRETIALVNAHLPAADTSVLAMQPGARVQPWKLP